MNTIEYEANAKNAEVVRFVNTIEYEASAKNAEVVRFVNTTDNEAQCKECVGECVHGNTKTTCRRCKKS